MRLPENPPLPATSDVGALLREVQKLMRQVSQQVNSLSEGRVAAANNAMSSVPTGGTWAKGDFVKNTNPSLLGPVGSNYIVDGWICVEGGTPGVWVEYRVEVSTPPASPAPTPAPTPAPAPSAYSQQILAENATLNGVTLVTDIPGYDGTGHADWIRWDGGDDEWIEFTFTSCPASASGDFTLHYANYGDQTCQLVINGAAPVMHTFPGSSGTWADLVIPNTSFQTGTNTVRILPEYSGYTYFNWAQFDQLTGGSAPPPPPPAPTPAPPAAPAPAPAPGSAPYYPFGSRLDLTASSYPYGIKPTHSTATMDAAVKACYDAWKLTRLTKSPTFTATHGIYAGQTITDAYHVSWGGTQRACVSEGIGYGMLITVVMAGYDANAKTYFDGLFRTARGRPAYGMSSAGGASTYLHAWFLNYDMSTGEPYNAADGDLDIALALLMAHRQWGSSGGVNYYQEALNTIAAMKAANFHSSGLMLAPQNVSRVSDYMPGHFRAFKAATNDSFWDDARTNSLAMVQQITANYSPTAKLQPGFIYEPLGSNPRPDTVARIDRSGVEHIYDGNAVRHPWRWATDFIYSGDTGWKGVTNDIVTTLKTTAGGSASGFSWAYQLDGTPMSGLYHDKGQAGCVMAGCMVDSAHQSFLDALFTANTGTGFSPVYYEGELQLLPLIVCSGNWWRP